MCLVHILNGVMVLRSFNFRAGNHRGLSSAHDFRRYVLRRIMLAVSLVAMLALSAVPALADDGDDRWDDRWDDRQEELFFDGFFFDGFFIEDDFDGFFFDDDEDFDRFDFDGALNQDVEQDAESGDIDQSFDVSQTGDNSSQCAGVQGVANTGNAQNVLDLTQVDGEVDDFEFDEVDSSIEVSPESSTTCDQQVNQAATATG